MAQKSGMVKAVITVLSTIIPSFSPNENTEGCAQIKQGGKSRKRQELEARRKAIKSKAGSKEMSQDDS